VDILVNKNHRIDGRIMEWIRRESSDNPNFSLKGDRCMRRVFK